MSVLFISILWKVVVVVAVVGVVGIVKEDDGKKEEETC